MIDPLESGELFTRPVRERYACLVDRGLSVTQIAEVLGRHSHSVVAAVSRYGLRDAYEQRHDLLRRPPTEPVSGEDRAYYVRRYPGLEERIREGRTLKDIGHHYGRSGEAVRLAAIKLGIGRVKQLPPTKEYEQERKQVLSGIAAQILNIGLSDPEASPAQKYAVMMRYSSDKTYEQLVTFYSDYFEAWARGERKSLKALGKRSAISPMTARRLLITAQLPPLTWRCRRPKRADNPQTYWRREYKPGSVTVLLPAAIPGPCQRTS